MKVETKTPTTPQVEVGSVIKKSGGTLYYIVARDNQISLNNFVLIGLNGYATGAPFVSNFRYKDLSDIQRDSTEVYPAARVRVVCE